MDSPEKELFSAAKSNNVAKAKSILTRGLVNVNAKDDSFAGTPLHYACIKGNYDVAKLLVETFRADVNALTSQRCSLSTTAP